jgi:hypothetical protein
MKLLIDRIEGEWAFVETEDGKIFQMAAQLLPEGSKESDAITIQKDNEYKIQREEKIKKLMDEVWE